MSRLLFLPVSRFSVRYTVANGRPFSELDRLVLRAIRENDSPTLDGLKATFQLPQRPLLENLVTLFHSGWIAMNSQGRLLATEEGVRALKFRTMPLSMRPVENNQMLLMETLMGLCVAVRGGVRYFTEQELTRTGHWLRGKVVEPVVSGILPDEGMIRGLLPRPKGGWIHNIADPRPRGFCAYYLPVVVDPETRRILGLPDRWVPLLEEQLLAAADQAVELDDSAVADVAPFPPNVQKLEEQRERLAEDDLITSQTVQTSALRAALQSAPPDSWIFIACERLDPSWLQAWRDAFHAALVNGVNIDVVWRTIERSDVTESGEVQLRHHIEVINQAASGHQRRGMLRAGPAPTEGRAHFVLVVPGRPQVAYAWIGGCDWLAPADDPRKIAVSVRIRELETLSKLALAASALLSSASANTLSALPETWRELAADLEGRKFMQEDRPDANCTVCLLRNRDLDASVGELLTRDGTIRLRGRLDENETPMIARALDRVDARLSADYLNSAILAGETLIVSASLCLAASPDELPLSKVGLMIARGPAVAGLERRWASDQATAGSSAAD